MNDRLGCEAGRPLTSDGGHKREEKDETEAKEPEQVVATSAQIAAFDVRLDDYDAKPVHALMENGEALDRVREQLRVMRDEAYVLPDGRRVFERQDGQRVFDEKGAEGRARRDRTPGLEVGTGGTGPRGRRTVTTT